MIGIHLKRKGFLLAIAVIVIELIGGMQSYLSQLILPIMSADFGSQNLYGIVMGVSWVASMTGLPFGAVMMKRFRLAPLLLVLTAVLSVGAVISAAAPNIWVYLVGQFLRSFTGSCLAMASIGAVALGLSGRARQLTLAFSSASWVVASIVGPSYAAWVTHLLSWRWAMLIYLPFLIAARSLLAASLEAKQETKDAQIPFKAVALITVAVCLTVIPVGGAWKYVFMVVGVALLGWAAVLLLPSNTFFTRTPRHRALAGMFFLTGGYFAANELIALTYHDIYQAGPNQLGLVLLAGGLGWSVMGVICGAYPARSGGGYRLRVGAGVLLIVVSAALLGVIVGFDVRAVAPAIAMVVLWTAAGVGMGSTYVDTLNVMFEEPAESDGLDMETVASSAMIVESLSSAMFVPLIASLVAAAFRDSATPATWPYSLSWFIICVLGAFAWIYLQSAGRSMRAAS